MATFEISPPKHVNPARNDREEPEVLFLAPFKPVPKLTFQNVKLKSKCSKLLIIRNASKANLFVELPSLPPPDRGFEFSFTEVELGADEEAILEIVWTPTEVGSWRESVPVRTSSKLRSEFVLICSTTVPQPKKTVKRPVAPKNPAKPTVLAKKLSVAKSNKPIKNSPKQASVSGSLVKQQVRIARSLPRSSSVTSSPCRRQTFLVNPENKENSPECAKETNSRNIVLKNKHDISRRFEDFVLSPLNTNSNVNQLKSSALDDFVMSPVVLPSVAPPRPGHDFVDGCAMPPKVLVTVHEEFKKTSNTSSAIRRETFEVANHLIQFGNKKEHLAETYVQEEDEFEDSLEEAQVEAEFLQPSPKKPTFKEIPRIEISNITHQLAPVVPEVSDSFMDSTLKFDLPLPSEDPRRCSTGVKVVTPVASSGANLNVRKDLFDLMSSPQTANPADCAALQLNVSEPFECISGGIPEMNDNCSNDRLSTDTYVKDRLSTSTYVKDRLSTETYVKEQNSRGSVGAHNDSNDSVFLHESAHLDNGSSVPHSPRLDEHHRHTRSALLSIQEEDTTSNLNGRDVRSSKLKSTAFTVEFPDPKERKGSVNLISSPSPGRSKTGARPKRTSSPKRKLIRVSPTLKSSCSALAKTTKVSRSVLPRRQTINGALPCSTGKRASSLKEENSDPKPSLTDRLPEARLSLSRAPRPSDSRLSLSRTSRLPDARLSVSNTSKQDVSVFKIPRGSRRLAQRMAEKSEPLHCLDDILAEVTNVDPFAASTTSDPFLNRAIFNDSAWIARQESDMIRWLNALLTPPTELETTDLPSIDIGDLWQKTCRLKDNSLAPSRETVSSDLYGENSRLNSLRKSAMGLIRSKEVASVLQKISVKVDQKILLVREDRDLHIDVGLQQLVLELLLSYNPLWLRIGLEAVYGRTVPLKNNSDYVGLTAFLVHNLLSDDGILATFSHPTVPHLKLPGFQEEMKKFTLKKFLFLVFFLDRAKTAKLIGHDPCLFARSSTYKESREIVSAFARDLLSGMGDINRYLAAFDCKLTVKQTFLDEFEYAVKGLLDLRDGVRLVRVMELITKTNNLHGKLRVPAISRLQKLHNVELALNALKEAGYALCGGIQAKDIADGHREKTLSLLWQIIYKFQAPRFTAAAEVLQRWWRSTALKRHIESRIRARKRARREAAAVVLQSAWRVVLARRRVALVREQRAREEAARQHAAVVLQKHWRRHAAEAALARARHAATSIARWYRGAVETRRLRQDFLQRRAAAVKLQAHWKGVLTRKRFTELRRMAAALRIQTWFRRRRTARRLLAAVDLARVWLLERRQRLEACRRLQSSVRAWMAMRRDRAHFVALRAAAVAVQRRWRAQRAMKAQRQRFLELVGAVLAVQRRWRARRAMEAERAAFLKQRRAAVTIQAWYRARRDRRRFLQVRDATCLLQQRWRGRQLTRHLRIEFLFQRRAARVLQPAVRAWLAGRQERARFLRLRAAALVVQRRVRARAALRDLKCARRQGAATVIQRWWRAVLAMKAPRQEYTAMRAAAVVLQRRYRARLAMKLPRQDYTALRRAAVVLQQQFRARLAMKAPRRDFTTLRSAALVLQRRYRAHLAMKAPRQEYSALRCAAIVLQRRYRARLAMKQARNDFQRLRSAALFVQARHRALKETQQQRQRFLDLKKAAVTVQRRWRARMAMALQLARFISLRRAACVLQSRYRGLLEMRRERNRFHQIRKAAIVIQRRFRADKLMKEQRHKYLELQKTALTVQCIWRAKCAMISERTKFQVLRHAVITVQRRWRALQAMRQQMQAFQSTRKAAVTIQVWWRSLVLARKQHNQFKLVRSSAIIIQKHWRMWKLVSQAREDYLSKKSAAIVLQKHARGFLTRKWIQREREVQETIQAHRENSAKIIQRTWRAWCSRRKEIYLKNSAATKIQSFYRGYLSRKRFEEETSRLKDLNEELRAQAPSQPQSMKERIGVLCCDLESETVGGVVMVLNALNTICMISPVLSEEMVAQDIVAKLFSVLCNVNRGVADMAVAKLASRVLLHLCKYEKTNDAVWCDGSYLNLFPHLMKKWISVEEGVLQNFITMLWHFSQNTDKAKIISSDEKLKSTLMFCINKFKNKKGKSVSSSLPSLQPNWGSLRKESRPFAFEDINYGLRALCFKLKISVNV
ncbi:protein abnormal spindle [Thrips palmi]|uniref:Protein abnormal spindle n=1 Tax=Thrips palmi TaxID=161013 RepID=A0A6P8YC60_THRPL|nr:protein abnormal spindle [Thrips palmi]